MSEITERAREYAKKFMAARSGYAPPITEFQVAQIWGNGAMCGENIKAGNFLVGCGRAIKDSRDLYRCYDCDVAFHRECLKRHCTEKKAFAAKGEPE